jgi:hypothetical protein
LSCIVSSIRPPAPASAAPAAVVLMKTAACRVEDVVNGEGYRFHDQWAPAVGAADDVRKRISEWRGRRRAHSGVTSGMPGQELRA